MAEGGSATFDLWLLLAALFVMFSLSVANIDLRGDRFVHTFEVSDFVEKNEIMVADDTDDVDDSWELRLPNIERHRRDADHMTDKCYAQEQKNLGALAEGKAIHSTFSFKDDKNHGLALTWCGEGDSGNMLVVTTEQIQTLLSVHVKPSVVYRTTDGGVTFHNISNLVENAYIKKGNGLQRNPHNAKLVYLVAHSRDDVNKIYLTNDGGLNFEARAVPFRTDESFHFHPEVTFQVHMLVRSSARSLFMTVDNGKTWKKIADDVHDFKWGSTTSEKGSRDYDGKVVYVLQYSTDNEENWWSSILGSNKVFQLKKSSDGGNTWKVLIEKALSFGLEGNFLYASVKGKKTGERIMKVSSNGGETWDETELPTILGDQFYSILDSSEGMIFMHVDNPGDTGHGTLYTSAGKGIIFSESLRKHLYPNFAQQTDFYKVESMRGVYVASQMLEDDSIHSRISYDRGGVWQSLPRPPNAPCKDPSKECSLQLHNTYSISRGITAKAPLSVAKAKGIVLAHGHVASSLQTTSPDVFITSDGGYTWKKTLDGPHHYQIADSGGMILAVPIASDKTATYVKFSLDQGDCWHTYNFTEDPIIFTGLLTEPGSKSLTIGLWGFTKNDSVWRVHTIDFNKLVPKRCEGEDYEEFVAHATLRKGENKDVEGCLLGVREKFHRIKPYSWCKNGYYPQPEETREVCKCTREDYECDYSYFRPVGSDKCEKEPQFKIKEVDICKRGHLEEIITQGYRKIPGDKCEKGEVYLDGKVLNLTQHCSNNQEVVKEEVKEEYIEKIEHEDNVVLEHKTPTKSSRKRFLIITAVSVVVLGLIGTMTLFFICRYYALRRHQVTYRYSLLNQTEEQDFDGDLENVLTSQSGVYGDSDDEEPRMSHSAVPNGRTNKRTTSQPSKPTPKVVSYHDDSDVDMLE